MKRQTMNCEHTTALQILGRIKFHRFRQNPSDNKTKTNRRRGSTRSCEKSSLRYLERWTSPKLTLINQAISANKFVDEFVKFYQHLRREKFPFFISSTHLFLSEFNSQFESIEMHAIAVLERGPGGVVIQQHFEFMRRSRVIEQRRCEILTLSSQFLIFILKWENRGIIIGKF